MKRVAFFALLLPALALTERGSTLAQVMAIQTPEAQTVAAATQVLTQFTTFQIQSIPQGLLNQAQGVVIIPNVLKLGFVVAGRYGRGVALVRTPEGAWRVPVFLTFYGGSVGWQAGLQSTDVVLVFKNRRGIESLLSGNKFTLGADAAIAAGPVGRQAATGTDLQFNAEIYSYSRSRGLFAGVSLDGSVIQIDNRANMAYYVNGTVPPQAIQLAQLMANDSAVATNGPLPGAPLGPLAPVTAPNDARESTRQALAQSEQQLVSAVDANWRAYLALPPQARAPGGAVSASDLKATMDRYNRIQTDPQYKAVAALPQFQATLALLKAYNDQSGAAAPAARTASAGSAK